MCYVQCIFKIVHCHNHLLWGCGVEICHIVHKTRILYTTGMYLGGFSLPLLVSIWTACSLATRPSFAEAHDITDGEPLSASGGLGER